MLNDATWAKYKLGEIVDLKDPKTNAHATRNFMKDAIPLHNISYAQLAAKPNVILVACNLALTVISGMAAEKAAQYASRSHELEERVRVLEQIVTDGGAQTAAQIEALRTTPARIGRKRVSADDRN